MAIRESLLDALNSIATSDFVRSVTAAGASSKVTVSNLAKTIVENYAGSTLAGSSQSVKSAIDAIAGDYQEKLVSGTNIKTINGNSVLGSGDVDVSASATDISSKITLGGSWTQLIKRAWAIGNIVFFEIEATAGSFNANTQYTIATIASGYRPSDVLFASGYTTDGSYNPKGTVSVLVRATGAIDIRTQLASSSGAYVFISGFYVI